MTKDPGEHGERGDYGDIRYCVADGVATVTLNRPDKLNAWTLLMQQELRHALDRAAADAAVRVIVVTGAGRGFCAGADLGRLANARGGQVTEAEVGPIARDPRPQANLEQPLSYPLAIPKP